ncbi:hypothetical protein [Mycolicibacterium lutetiense]
MTVMVFFFGPKKPPFTVPVVGSVANHSGVIAAFAGLSRTNLRSTGFSQRLLIAGPPLPRTAGRRRWRISNSRVNEWLAVVA